MSDVLAVILGFIIELPVFMGASALLRKKRPGDKPVRKEAKPLAVVLAIVLIALFLFDILSGAPLSYMIVFLAFGLIAAAGTARRPVIAVFLILAWMASAWGFFLAVRWVWNYEDGYVSVYEPAPPVEIQTNIGDGGRIFQSVLFPMFGRMSFKPPYTVRVLLRIPGSPRGTAYRVSDVRIKEGTLAARPLKIIGKQGFLDALEGTMGEEALPTDTTFDPAIYVKVRIDTAPSFYVLEFDLAFVLPEGPQTRHIRIQPFRRTDTTLTWEPFNIE